MSEYLGGTDEAWSILEGYFDEAADFPNLEKVENIWRTNRHHDDETTARTLYCTDLILYALETVNPKLFADRDTERSVSQSVHRTVEDLSHQVLQLDFLGEAERRQMIKDVATKRVEPPMEEPSKIPIMQAFKAMQESGAISYETRTFLDDIAKAIHIKQSR